MIIIVDFGSQTCHLIARRVRDFGIETKIADPEIKAEEIQSLNPEGIILSGGPSSVYESNAPTVDKKIFDLKIPLLGICYGQQLIAHLLKGKVAPGKSKEFGPVQISYVKNILFDNIPKNRFRVWMSHGDEVKKLPLGFKCVASSDNIAVCAMANEEKRIYSLQFHPEVKHTRFGQKILHNFVHEICSIPIKKRKIKLEQIIDSIKEKVGGEKVICAISGGVDSTVAAVLIGKAIGKQLYPIYIESGLMRIGTKEEVITTFKNLLYLNPIIVEAQDLFLKQLKGVTDAVEKRKIIGALYIQLFEKEALKIKNVKFLAQGTIYSDAIESKGTRYASRIRYHHNVAALPEKMGFKLIEPMREFYKDEVRLIGKKLGLADKIVQKQPFPGPGQAIRIIGEVNEERLKQQQQADSIVLEEIYKAGLYNKIFQSFSVMTGVQSTAVKGDAGVTGEVVALRIYDSTDVMTASWSRLPYDLLGKIAARIVNEVPDVARVVYDITTKPPATMEWE